MSRFRLGIIGLVAFLGTGMAILSNPRTSDAQDGRKKDAPAKTTGSGRKMSWKELDGSLYEIKSKYRPTQADWDKGDEHLVKKLTSLLEELKGRHAGSIIALDVVNQIEPGLKVAMVKTLFEKLGVAPLASDRKTSWEKLEAMLMYVPSASKVTQEDWKKGDEHLLDTLFEVGKSIDRQVTAIMLENASRAAIGQREDEKKFLAALSELSKLGGLVKEIQSAGKEK